MALTTSEEALVRQLLDQQAAILSLAGNEATITSKLGATKVTLADLVAANGVEDADLLLMRQGTTDKSVTPLLLKGYAQDGMATQKGVQAGDYNTSVAAGTADAITADFTPNVALTNGTTVIVRAGVANTTTTPTFSPDGLTAKTIVKGNNLALTAGDIAGAGHWLLMQYDATLDKWVLLNPATGISVTTVPDATTAVKGKVQLATSAEAQAGTDAAKAITPATLMAGLNASGSAPIFACRAWVNFNGTGTVAIRASGNVSSITDNGVGLYTVNFTTAMPDASYSVVATGQTDLSNSRDWRVMSIYKSTTLATSSVKLGSYDNTDTIVDSPIVCVSIFR